MREAFSLVVLERQAIAAVGVLQSLRLGCTNCNTDDAVLRLVDSAIEAVRAAHGLICEKLPMPANVQGGASHA